MPARETALIGSLVIEIGYKLARNTRRGGGGAGGGEGGGGGGGGGGVLGVGGLINLRGKVVALKLMFMSKAIPLINNG